MQYRGEYSSFPDLDIALIIRRLLAGLWRLFVALKFHIHQFVFGSRGGYRLPWFRIGLAVLTLFILTKKDVQFSINMKAPLAGFMGGNENANDASVDQLGVAQTISFKESSAVPKAIHLPDDEIIKGYINRFDRVARAEMEKFGIPASIQIGQAILESRAGKSPSARDHNNHFGAPLGGKAFDSAWANWRAHSLLIVQEHNELLELGQSYKKWAKGLVKAGLGQGKNYDQRLIDIIEKFQLYNLDETL
ncbi:MAG: hypothetical protein DHS20C18_29930 [Saprospiraceae bacterium]|nr:MAG: hypothetical protein DHS20C18_29930 [Saprospiraceae bacterium]